MISANFAVAVITVVLRGLLDRLLLAPPAPQTSLIPHSTGIMLISGAAYLIYNHLSSGRRLQVTYSKAKRRKVLDGRLRKHEYQLHGPLRTSLNRSFSSSQSSSACDLDEKEWLSRKRRSNRSRSRCRGNLMQAAKDSLQMLHECSSTCSSSSKSSASLKCRCVVAENGDVRTAKERSPSLYSIKSDGENGDGDEVKGGVESVNKFKGFGDWEEHASQPLRRRKKLKSTRKTRSGKIYSSYL